MSGLTKEEEFSIGKEVIANELYKDLDYLGTQLTIHQVVEHTTDYYDVNYIKEVIENNCLHSIRQQGQLYINKSDFIDWYSDKIKDSNFGLDDDKLL